MRLKVKVFFCDDIFFMELNCEIEYVHEVTIYVELFICT